MDPSLRGRTLRRARARTLIAIVTAASVVAGAVLATLFWVVLTQTHASGMPTPVPRRGEVQIDDPSSAAVGPGAAARS
ncbi:hypothetical protein GCM10010464_08490 [Pseudonocardia yunnanensis]|uniref:Two-component sensor histidine kinase n=1 Tax=Pseudonocardia yunnanensis TaxID=58107 RepID=A0ABW4ENQ0_9PSEU